MGRRTGSLSFRAVTIILVMVTAFCCAGTVMSRTDLGERELELYYRERERQLVEETKEYLRSQGYGNSGVMLTRVVDADGSREYTLNIHHSRITALSKENQDLLADGLQDITFEDQNCIFLISM
ncbi:MAG: hypothetical protein NC331_02285 [Lachnospiraceae bacterium]|nr:hypothetical protein [Lachnospiraceae bacterium]MCM1238193.1 hypothetical protein [Lachnospiraceae bacterium]